MDLDQLLDGYAYRSEQHSASAAVVAPKKCASSEQLSALMMIAHDLRGPLANLGLLIESITLSSAREDNERVATCAHKAEVTIDHLNALFSSILKRARSERDPLEFKAAPVQLSELLETVVALNEPVAQKSRVHLKCHTNECLDVLGDENLLHEVIDNLINNAIKHTPPGGRVICETTQVKNEILVRVTDEGPGLTENDLAFAFRPFTRLSSMKKETSNSFGLGLWIARLITERHRGKIKARNRPDGNGAIFTLHLPTD